MASLLLRTARRPLRRAGLLVILLTIVGLGLRGAGPAGAQAQQTDSLQAAPDTTAAPEEAAADTLLDASLFFRTPRHGDARLSPDGRFIAFRKRHGDIMNVWVMRTQDPVADAQPVTTDTTHAIASYRWSADSKRLLYVQNQDGGGRHLYAVDLVETEEPARGFAGLEAAPDSVRTDTVAADTVAADTMETAPAPTDTTTAAMRDTTIADTTATDTVAADTVAADTVMTDSMRAAIKARGTMADTTETAMDSLTVPEPRDLTPYGTVEARLLALPPERPNQAVVGLDRQQRGTHDVYRLNLVTGQDTLVLDTDRTVDRWLPDREGRVRYAVQRDAEGTGLFRVGRDTAARLDTLASVYDCGLSETCRVRGYHPDGERLYLETNRGASIDRTRLIIFDPETGRRQVVASDPDDRVDLGGALFTRDTSRVEAVYYDDRRRRYDPQTDAFEADRDTLRQRLSGDDFDFLSVAEGGGRRLVRAYRATDPGTVYLYDRQSSPGAAPSADDTLRALYDIRPEVEPRTMAPTEPIEYRARDGLTILAYLTRPRTAPADSTLPLVVLPHDGPWQRVRWAFDPFAQFLANRGYAVLQPNYRGSAGFGQRFLEAGNAAWGTRIQDDLLDGVQHLAENGAVDTSRVALLGYRFGGYAAQAGLAFHPDRYAAAVSYAGPPNILTWVPRQQQRSDDFTAARYRQRVGDLDALREQRALTRQSPLFYANEIDDPLLVVQGGEDPVATKGEADQMVVALQRNDVPVRYIVDNRAPGRFRNPRSRRAAATAIEQFLGEHLGGQARDDSDLPVTTRQRLIALEADPAALSLPDDAIQMRALPDASGAAVATDSMAYTSTFEVGGLDIPDTTITLRSRRTVESAQHEGRAVWRVAEQTYTPRGTYVDTFEVDVETMVPVRRHLDANLRLRLQYAPQSVQGRIEADGDVLDVNDTFDRPVGSNDTGLELAIAGLPLTEGYTQTVNVYEPRRRATRTFRITVTGEEEIRVPAGTFSTYVVDFQALSGTSVETGTLHVMQAPPHYVVQRTVQMPDRLGGNVLTRRLTYIEGRASADTEAATDEE